MVLKKGTDMGKRSVMREKLIETAKLLATPIDFEGLIGSGVLVASRRAWYEVLQPERVPAHVWQQATGLRNQTRGDKQRNFLKFGKSNAAAARLYEKLTGEPLKVGGGHVVRPRE
jgi:hypothetical protein